MIKVKNCYLWPFTIPFQSESPYVQRQGFFLVIEDDEGHRGLGECAPLPGMGVHRESLTQALQSAMKDLLPFLSGRSFSLSRCKGLHPDGPDSNPSLFAEQLMNFLRELPRPSPGVLPASLVSALDQAYLTLYLQREVKEMVSGPPEKRQIPVNALILPYEFREENLAHLATYLRQEDFSTAKIKIGRRPGPEGWREEIALIRQLFSKLEGKVQLRLDANGSLTMDQLGPMAEELHDVPVDYLEGPLRSVQDYQNGLFPHESHRPLLPIALDETLRDLLVNERSAEENWPHIVDFLTRTQDQGVPWKSLIIKPTAFPGLIWSCKLFQLARELRLQVILISSFDSPWSLLTWGYLARFMGLQGLSHGFGTAHHMRWGTGPADQCPSDHLKLFPHKKSTLELPANWWNFWGQRGLSEALSFDAPIGNILQ